MKIAFYILTFLVCGVAAYFSLSHKEMFEDQQNARTEAIETNKNVAARADVAEADIGNRETEVQEAQTLVAQANASLESVQSTGRSLANQISEIESNIASQKEEENRLNESNVKIREMLAEFGEDVTPTTIAQTIADLQRQRDELVKRRDDIEEEAKAAEAALAEKRVEAERVTQRVVARNAQLSLNATEAVISAVNHDWGFVLIGAGSNSGFAPQSSMIVQRDGRVIGRVRPSSIEPTQTVAEIDYSTLPVGVRFQPGDRVLLAVPVAN